MEDFRVREVLSITVILSKRHSRIIQRTDAQKVPVLFYIYKKATKVKKGKFYAKQNEQPQ